MLIRPSKHVDVSGRCNIEYIQHWEKKSEVRLISIRFPISPNSCHSKACNLSALLEALQQEFSRGPPVYAKPKPTTSSSPSPIQRSSYSSTPSSPSGHTNDPPALPPKPASTSTSNSVQQKPPTAAPTPSPQYSSTVRTLITFS